MNNVLEMRFLADDGAFVVDADTGLGSVVRKGTFSSRKVGKG
jgi:hypothetical protein